MLFIPRGAERLEGGQGVEIFSESTRVFLM